ncbi:MAG: hypothetical protein A2Y56_14050 [Candidatus Aminicenantes bacterium RBG_13_63_10]|nr:MAG: hypothetical protein A2Y56_14050 [Candidatus Aminicenantes bacterium RBG_13_63_10]
MRSRRLLPSRTTELGRTPRLASSALGLTMSGKRSPTTWSTTETSRALGVGSPCADRMDLAWNLSWQSVSARDPLPVKAIPSSS